MELYLVSLKKIKGYNENRVLYHKGNLIVIVQIFSQNICELS